MLAQTPLQAWDNQRAHRKKILTLLGLVIAALFLVGGAIFLSTQLGLFRGDNRQRAFEPTAVNITNAAGEQITAMATGTVNIVGQVCGNNASGGKVYLFNLQDKHVKFVTLEKGTIAFSTKINTRTPYFIFFQPDGSAQILGYTDENHQLKIYTENTTTQNLALKLCDTNTDSKSIPTDTFTVGD